MKRGLLLACALMVNASLASAEVVSAPLPDRHIQTAIERETYTIAVDADIYGETIDRVQAYRVTTLDWGENPEEAFDLALWFDETVPLEKKDYDSIAFFPQGQEERILWRDEARFSPYAITFQRETHARLEFPFERLAVEGIVESVDAQLLEGFSLQQAEQGINPILDALGVTIQREPVFVSCMTLGDWQAETGKKLAYGVAPDEFVVEDWTEADESCLIHYRQLFHGLPMMETDEHMPGIVEWETPKTLVCALWSRRGLEKLEFPFVVGTQTALGEPFAPITADEALAACQSADMNLGEWRNLHISRIELGYVMLAKNIAQTEIEARPAWLIRIWGEILGNMESVVAAVDAQTGDMMLSL